MQGKKGKGNEECKEMTNIIRDAKEDRLMKQEEVDSIANKEQKRYVEMVNSNGQEKSVKVLIKTWSREKKSGNERNGIQKAGWKGVEGMLVMTTDWYQTCNIRTKS